MYAKISEKLKKLINRETILYVVFGVLTTAVNYAVYYPLIFIMGEQYYLLINVIAWIAAVIFAFIVNKIWVFESRDGSVRTVVREFLLFAAARLFSLGLEELFLYVTVGILGWNNLIMKLIAAVFVIVINYFFSKFIIFKKKSAED